MITDYLREEDYLIEVCANSTESGVEAQTGGARRIELCAGIPEGGTTPSYGEILAARKHLQIAVNVIIRPRGGDFLYNDYEIEAMLADIRMCKDLGVDGVVFGALTPDGDIDVETCRRLKTEAAFLSTTFHRAFDVCRNPQKALDQIIDLGFDRLLTSGQAPTAPEGAALIRWLNEQSAGRVIIMPGCGVNENNIAQLRADTGCREFHMSARHSVESGMKYRNPVVSMGGTVHISEYSRDVTDASRVRKSLSALK